MKPLMMRWKAVPVVIALAGEPFRKLATVLGATSGQNSTVMSP
jgi:hypothetical protein